MSQQQKPTSQPRGPEGVPLDAPGNDAPAISPHAVSRMHRAEDDDEARGHSVDFTDERAVAHERAPVAATQRPESPARAGTGQTDDALGRQDPKNGKRNPSHDTHKSPEERPRGAGDGELMEQPHSQSEAREPGAEDSKFDE
jgi:hypothetical protein